MTDFIEMLVPLHSSSKCSSCQCSVGTKSSGRIRKGYHIDKTLALDLYRKKSILVGSHHRLCSQCKEDDNLSIPTTSVRFTENLLLIRSLLGLIDARPQTRVIEKQVPSFQLYYNHLSSSDLEEACGLPPSNLEDLSSRISIESQFLFQFLMICRQGLSQYFAGVLSSSSQSTISKNFNHVLDALTEKFVPLHLGSSAFSRDTIIRNHTPLMFSRIWPNVRGIIDGTYIYCEKSSDFNVQRKTFSGQKKRNLIKLMGIVLPDGRFFDLVGPFFSDGDHSDQWMWEWIIDSNCADVCDVFQFEKDEFMADRGFIRCQQRDDADDDDDVDDALASARFVGSAVSRTFKLHCPVGLSGGRKQLSAEDANKSRLITRFRNVVERAFGRLKMR